MWIGIHMQTAGIETGEIDFDPRFGGRGFEGSEGVARDAVGPHDAFLASFADDVHDRPLADVVGRAVPDQ